MDLDGLAALKADGEVLDELALIGQRLCGIDDAPCHAALREMKTSSVGMFGLKKWPSREFSPPPLNSASSIMPTLKFVPFEL